MEHARITFDLAYSGGISDDASMEFYDTAQALIGFQRSLALTTHLILNGKVITQAPSLKGATIYASPPEAGSWKISAGLAIATAIYTAGTAPRDTPIGHLVSSAYDYVISESLGFHVDYDKTLGQHYKEFQQQDENVIPGLKQSNFDSLIEKCESAIENMHRPIVSSESAEQASILANIGGMTKKIDANFTKESFEYFKYTVESEKPEILKGRVSGYNLNTFKGRIYLPDEVRPIPFDLSKNARGPEAIQALLESMRRNAENPNSDYSDIKVSVLKRKSRSGRLKSVVILDLP